MAPKWPSKGPDPASKRHAQVNHRAAEASSQASSHHATVITEDEDKQCLSDTNEIIKIDFNSVEKWQLISAKSSSSEKPKDNEAKSSMFFHR